MSSANNPPAGGFGPARNFAAYGRERAKLRDRRGTIKRIYAYLADNRARLLLVALLVVLYSLGNVAGPYLMAKAIDSYIAKHDLSGLWSVCLAMIGAYGVAALSLWMQGFVMVGIAQNAIFKIRSELIQKIQRLPLRYFDSRPDGDVMSRVTNDVDRLNSVLTDSFPQFVSGALGLLGVLIVMLIISPLMTCITVGALVGISFALNRIIVPNIGAGFRGQQKHLGEINGIINESVSGLRVIKSFGLEADWGKKFQSVNEQVRKAGVRGQSFAVTIGPMMNGSNNLALTLVAGSGGWMVIQGLVSVGTVAAFIQYARQFARPLNELANLVGTIETGLAGAERIFELMDAPVEAETGNEKLQSVHGDVEFKNVWFSYVVGNPILKDVSLKASAGSMIALVGPTGAGKTTIINLLTRFYDIDSGIITIDGVDIRRYEKESLRSQIGIVLQDSFLFGGTVRDNIRYGRLSATDAEVESAATMANAHAFILNLPNGYDTPVSERGNNLSAGQRQLITIARTLLADPKILILDEATSSVDTRTEKQIQEAMRQLFKGRTCFVIAHRLSTVRDADQILVLQSGKIVERGTHEELVRLTGLYYRLVHAGENI